MLQEVKARGDDGGVWRVAVSGVVMWRGWSKPGV